MEEANAWRNPVDLVALLERAFAELPERAPQVRRGAAGGTVARELVGTLLDGEPAAILDALLEALREGATEVELASAVAVRGRDAHRALPDEQRVRRLGYRAAHLHVRERRRAGSAQVALAGAAPRCPRRGDERPPRPLPQRSCEAATGARARCRSGRAPEPSSRALLDRQQRVDDARQLAASFLAAGGEPRRLVAALGAALVREDRNFHTIQCVEAAARQYELLAGTNDEQLSLIAAAGYLAAHATTTRSQNQTFEIARRLHRGEKLYEEDEG